MSRNCVRVVCPRCGTSEGRGVTAVIAEWTRTYARFREYAEAYKALTAFLDRTFAELEAAEVESDRVAPSQGGRVLVPFGRKSSRRQ